ncbi:hypothetical protein CEXT_531281 [Caerostris extrusa]|uniref:Uncharacterized protein n=1 Tax=Caerostris extrusa TaxID=172846 RepID=A0AAV4TDJ1_CAEEX|nr:hypothetical protein CEXT_531281 [Caerostris extrusa]
MKITPELFRLVCAKTFYQIIEPLARTLLPLCFQLKIQRTELSQSEGSRRNPDSFTLLSLGIKLSIHEDHARAVSTCVRKDIPSNYESPPARTPLPLCFQLKILRTELSQSEGSRRNPDSFTLLSLVNN